jgi:hypothetical protein
VDVEVGAVPEQLDQRHRRERCAPGGLSERFELGQGAHHHVEVIPEGDGCRAGSVGSQGYGGTGKGGQPRPRGGKRFGIRRSTVGVESDDQDRLPGQRREVLGGVGRLQSLDRLL